MREKEGDKVKEAVWGKDKTLGQTVRPRETDKTRESLPFFQRAWQPLPLCSFVLFVVGVITCGPGQEVSPLCLI